MNILLNTQKPNGERYGWKVAWHTENDGLHNFIVDGDSVFNDTSSIWVYAMVDTGGGSLNYIGGAHRLLADSASRVPYYLTGRRQHSCPRHDPRNHMENYRELPQRVDWLFYRRLRLVA